MNSPSNSAFKNRISMDFRFSEPNSFETKVCLKVYEFRLGYVNVERKIFHLAKLKILL